MRSPRLLSLCVLLCAAMACQRAAVPTTIPEKVVGHCTYVNKFSSMQECRDYLGEWTGKDATSDCEDQGSTVELGSACGEQERLGYCFLGGKSDKLTRISLLGSDASKCASMQRGCELFGGGAFDPSPLCGGKVPESEDTGTGLPTFEHPTDSIFVTTDPARIARFFEAELAARGYKREDFADQPYGAGPLDSQRLYVPTACDKGEGVGADGTVNWRGGKARYVYVMEASTMSPTVPPNLDLPEGTLWRLDVPEGGQALESGTVRYGSTPPGMTQRFPLAGAPVGLTSGKTYYLYVLQDIILPVTRCLFTQP